MDDILKFIRALYDEPDAYIPLHAPVFAGREKEYLAHCIDSSYVSSVGEYVTQFENLTKEYTGAGAAVAVVNGTCALTAALGLAGVGTGDIVLTQGLTFVATANAITHAGATPVFLDVDSDTLGLSPKALRSWLEANHGRGPRIAACVPVHILGYSCRIREICSICAEYSIPVVEDAAEGLGSFWEDQHLGTFGQFGILSYNGNKTITTGGGGMILSQDEASGKVAKHLTSTAKMPHAWEFHHDQVGWNYRMPNINAALGCAQMEKLESILKDKQDLAKAYFDFFTGYSGAEFINVPEGCSSNHWLNTVLFETREQRDSFLKMSNEKGIMTRPLWDLMTDLPMYSSCVSDGLTNGHFLVERAVSLPSGPRMKVMTGSSV